MRITAILTTYNSGPLLDRTVQSVLNQEGAGELFELEVIAVDDLSTDGTLERLKKYPIQVLTNETNSGGPNAGRNKGLKAMTGDYFCIVDHDDQWMPNRLKEVLPLLERAPIVSTGFDVINESRGSVQHKTSEGIRSFGKGETFKQKLKRKRQGQNTYLGSLVVSAALKHILFEEVHGKIDFDWVLRIFEGRQSVEVGKALYNRYVDGTNLSLNPTYRRHDYEFSLEVFKKYEAQYPKEVLLGRRRLNSSRGKYFYLMGDMKQARYFLLRGRLAASNVLYFFTTFVGRKWVMKHFTIFG